MAMPALRRYRQSQISGKKSSNQAGAASVMVAF
jgi:hypothetical protein